MQTDRKKAIIGTMTNTIMMASEAGLCTSDLALIGLNIAHEAVVISGVERGEASIGRFRQMSTFFADSIKKGLGKESIIAYAEIKKGGQS